MCVGGTVHRKPWARAAPEAMFETVDALRLLARSTQPDVRFLSVTALMDDTSEKILI